MDLAEDKNIPSDDFPSDEQLVNRIRLGDEQAFEALFERYVDRLTAFAFHFIQDRDSSEELVAGVFASIWTQRSSWQISVSVGNYLFTSVRNRALNTVRSLKRAEVWKARFNVHGEVPGTGERIPRPDQKIELEELRIQLNNVMKTLPSRTRAIFMLRWIEQMSFPEIAKIMGGSSSAAQVQCNRALKLLRKSIPEYLK